MESGHDTGGILFTIYDLTAVGDAEADPELTLPGPSERQSPLQTGNRLLPPPKQVKEGSLVAPGLFEQRIDP